MWEYTNHLEYGHVLIGWALIGGLCSFMYTGESGDEAEHREGGPTWREAGGPGREGR